MSIAIEAVSFANRLCISLSKIFCPGQCGDQHQQRSTWQVKICEKGINHLERKPWRHKHIRLSTIGLDLAGCPNRSFECAYDGGSHSDNSSPCRTCLLDGTYRLYPDVNPFCTHTMMFDQIGRHRLEGANSDMQRDGCETNPSLLQLRQ